MGYTTEFRGQFTCDPPLTDDQAEYLRAFSRTRRMDRDSALVDAGADPIREAVGLPVGARGEYFVGGGGFAGQAQDESIQNYNRPPPSQPGLWCQWVPTEDGGAIEWDGVEEFYNYTEWLEYIIRHFLMRWGVMLNGDVQWRGESWDDNGTIRVTNNRIEVL